MGRVAPMQELVVRNDQSLTSPLGGGPSRILVCDLSKITKKRMVSDLPVWFLSCSIAVPPAKYAQSFVYLRSGMESHMLSFFRCRW